MIIFSYLLGDPVMATVDAVIKISMSTSRGRNFPISRQRITDCVHAMWDEGLQYDNATKVLARLIAEVIMCL